MRIVDSHFHWWPESVIKGMMNREGFPRVEKLEEPRSYRWQMREDGRGRLPVTTEWHDLDYQIKHMDDTGRDFDMILSTGPIAIHFQMIPADEARDVCVAWNEEWAGAQRKHAGRIWSTCVVPLTDTQAAIDTLDDAVFRLGLRAGVSMPSSIGANGNIDEERLEPFYDRVEELGIPLFLHPTDAYFLDAFPGYNGQLFSALGRVVEVSTGAFRLILSGVMERHPKLKVFMSHTGGALPYQAGRMDKNTRPSKLMPEKPSTYLKRMYVDTVSPHSIGVDFAIEYFGEDHVMYGDDYPCWTPENSLEVFEGVDLSDPVREKVYSSNARRFWELDKAPVTAPELVTARR
jgi:aminocarboxymuconate-semialdehyde decarboxylase